MADAIVPPPLVLDPTPTCSATPRFLGVCPTRWGWDGREYQHDHWGGDHSHERFKPKGQIQTQCTLGHKSSTTMIMYTRFKLLKGETLVIHGIHQSDSADACVRTQKATAAVTIEPDT